MVASEGSGRAGRSVTVEGRPRCEKNVAMCNLLARQSVLITMCFVYLFGGGGFFCLTVFSKKLKGCWFQDQEKLDLWQCVVRFSPMFVQIRALGGPLVAFWIFVPRPDVFCIARRPPSAMPTPFDDRAGVVRCSKKPLC